MYGIQYFLCFDYRRSQSKYITNKFGGLSTKNANYFIYVIIRTEEWEDFNVIKLIYLPHILI